MNIIIRKHLTLTRLKIDGEKYVTCVCCSSLQFTADEKEEPEVDTITSERGAGDMEQVDVMVEGAESSKPLQNSGDVMEGASLRLAEKSDLKVGEDGEEKKDEEKPVRDSPPPVSVTSRTTSLTYGTLVYVLL